MELTGLLPDLVAASGHSDRIKLFGWWLHTYGARTRFSAANVKDLYVSLSLEAPSTFGSYFDRLHGKKELLKDKNGYYLEAKVRAALDTRFGAALPATHIKITATLEALPKNLPTLVETQYLDEALRCYRAGAPRAAMVMTWNLAYAHLCAHILDNKLAEFNARWPITFPGMHRNGVKTIAVADDFNRYLKEQEVLDIARDGSVIVKNVHGVLEINLKKRNMAAHPNGVQFTPLQVDAYIEDLVNNAILQIM